MFFKDEPVRCSWCQLVASEGDWNEVDHLKLHNKPIFRHDKSCVELYRNYCKWIKEKTE